MELKKAKTLAASLFKVGETRVYIDPAQEEAVKAAITKDDVRGLIGKRIIKKRSGDMTSKGRARVLQAKKAKGRKRGHGKRTGSFKARAKPREKWMKTVRALRETLRALRKEKGMDSTDYQKYYRLIKGNYFRGKKQLKETVTNESK